MLEFAGDESDWPDLCAEGHKQSPLNFVKDEVQIVGRKVLKVEFSQAWCDSNTGIFLRNTGRSSMGIFPLLYHKILLKLAYWFTR